jgi:endoglucanase Acf2
MRIFIFLLFTAFFSIQFSFSQTLRDFKKKTEENTKERTAMLDLLRSDIKNYLEQDVVFVVNHFKVYGSYAWIEGTVQRKDGKEIVFTEDAYDCCHVEALFKKVNGAWILKENGAFSTDVWYVCIVSNYPEASRQIFSEQILSNQENCRN